MKKALYIIHFTSYILLTSCTVKTDNSSTGANGLADKLPKIQFEKDAQGFDFGDLTEGQAVEHTFKLDFGQFISQTIRPRGRIVCFDSTGS